MTTPYLAEFLFSSSHFRKHSLNVFPLVYSSHAMAQSTRLLRAQAQQKYQAWERRGRCSPCNEEPGKADHSDQQVNRHQMVLCRHHWVWEAQHVWEGLWGAPAISASLHGGDTSSYRIQVKPARDKTWCIFPFQQHKMHWIPIYHCALCTFPSSSWDVHFTDVRGHCRDTGQNPGMQTISHDLCLKDHCWLKKIILAFADSWATLHIVSLVTVRYSAPGRIAPHQGSQRGQCSCCCFPLHWHIQGDAWGLG